MRVKNVGTTPVPIGRVVLSPGEDAEVTDGACYTPRAQALQQEGILVFPFTEYVTAPEVPPTEVEVEKAAPVDVEVTTAEASPKVDSEIDKDDEVVIADKKTLDKKADKPGNKPSNK